MNIIAKLFGCYSMEDLKKHTDAALVDRDREWHAKAAKIANDDKALLTDIHNGYCYQFLHLSELAKKSKQKHSHIDKMAQRARARSMDLERGTVRVKQNVNLSPATKKFLGID